MILRKNKITIYRSKRPPEDNVNEELRWFCDSLGLFGERDRDKSCFRMFVALLKALHGSRGMTSDEIADSVALSRGTVVHHLHTLMGSGLVVQDRSVYMLRVDRLSTLVEEIEHDLMRSLEDIKKAAEEIDKRLEL